MATRTPHCPSNPRVAGSTPAGRTNNIVVRKGAVPAPRRALAVLVAGGSLRQPLEPGIESLAVVVAADVKHDLTHGAGHPHTLSGSAALGHEWHGQHDLGRLDDAEDAGVEL